MPNSKYLEMYRKVLSKLGSIAGESVKFKLENSVEKRFLAEKFQSAVKDYLGFCMLHL